MSARRLDGIAQFRYPCPLQCDKLKDFAQRIIDVFAPLHALYLAYMRWCLPVIARIATGGDASAYEYLVRGIHEFPDQRTFCREMERFGFRDVSYRNMTLGIVALHSGVKPS